jgi:hypothetical protein
MLVTHIAAHEQRHVDIELDAARKLERQIRALPWTSDCTDLRYALDVASRTHRAEAQRAHRQFHVEDAARRTAAQRALEAVIDAKRQRLIAVESEIVGLDRLLSDPGARPATTPPTPTEGRFDIDAAVARRAHLTEKSRTLQSMIERLVERYKFTW